MPHSHTIRIAPHKRLRGVVNILDIDPAAGDAFGYHRQGTDVHESMTSLQPAA